jgi:uncharacterized membrane protein SirB2
MNKYLQQFGWHWGIILIGIVLFITGLIGLFSEPFQFVVKKIFLLSLWYVFAYLIRVKRIGHINWDDEWAKRIYYFLILIGASLIVAFA